MSSQHPQPCLKWASQTTLGLHQTHNVRVLLIHEVMVTLAWQISNQHCVDSKEGGVPITLFFLP